MCLWAKHRLGFVYCQWLDSSYSILFLFICGYLSYFWPSVLQSDFMASPVNADLLFLWTAGRVIWSNWSLSICHIDSAMDYVNLTPFWWQSDVWWWLRMHDVDRIALRSNPSPWIQQAVHLNCYPVNQAFYAILSYEIANLWTARFWQIVSALIQSGRKMIRIVKKKKILEEGIALLSNIDRIQHFCKEVWSIYIQSSLCFFKMLLKLSSQYKKRHWGNRVWWMR